MKAGAFIELVELRTKTASILPFLGGTLFAVYQFKTFDLVNGILMLVSLLCIDLATTTLNNLLENITERSVFHYAGRKYSKASAIRLVMVLLFCAILTGGYLGTRTGPITWFIGILSFGIGLTYSAGPLPIQRTPYGELLAGGVMGLGIFFLACFIHLGPDSFQAFTFGDRFTLDFNYKHLGSILLVALPFMGAIANVMLANNISDLDDDLKKRRYTLPVSIGKNDALFLFNLIYLATGGTVLLAVIAKQLPLTGLLMVFVYGLVMRNARRFSVKPNKKTTFPLALMNLNLIGGGLILIIGTAILFKL